MQTRACGAAGGREGPAGRLEPVELERRRRAGPGGVGCGRERGRGRRRRTPHLLERPSAEGPDPQPGRYCLRLHKNRVFYASESLVRRATAVSRVRLAGVGTPIGKFTHGGAFHLTVHSLDLLAAHACRRVWLVWLKPDTERSFLLGNSVPKSALARITENTKSGVVMSMADVPLGFGIATRGAQDCRKADTNAVVVLHQSDAGEYLWKEEELM